MTPRCFQIRPEDNVATMIDDSPGGVVERLGGPLQGEQGEAHETLVAAETITASHKIALRDIGAEEPVIKFGVRIGHATQWIPRGAWVHLHNLASDLDERSGTLDLHSGAPTDTRYE